MSVRLPPVTRLWLFLYGLPNIVGAIAGLIGLTLAFVGIIGPGWPWLVAGLYGLGWLIAWQVAPPAAHLSISREAHAEALLDELGALVRRVQGRLPQEARQRLASLHQTLAELLPRLSAGAVFSEEAHGVEKTVRDYLPVTLENYLSLPSTFARVHVLREGKTAQMLLIEQLTLLDEQMQAMLANAVSQDARALTENGIFLERKFKPYDFFQAG